jgi:hypothetical protein
VPVWFWWEGALLYFSTHPESAKARNLMHQPEIVVHNGDGADPIIIRGTSEPVQDPAELARVDTAYSAKYIDPHSGTEAPLLGLDETPATVFRVRPRLISAWSYAVYATRTDWRFTDAAKSGERAARLGQCSGMNPEVVPECWRGRPC